MGEKTKLEFEVSKKIAIAKCQALGQMAAFEGDITGAIHAYRNAAKIRQLDFGDWLHMLDTLEAGHAVQIHVDGVPYEFSVGPGPARKLQ